MKSKRFTKRDHIYNKPTINADSFDQRRFNELLHMSKGLQRVRNEGKYLPLFEQLMGDVWSSFFKNKPELLKNNEIQPELANNHQLMKRVLNDETYKASHEFTKLDDLHSALNTIGFSSRIFHWIKEQIGSNAETKEALDNMKQQESQHGKDSIEHEEAYQEFISKLGKQLENSDGSQFSEMLKQTMEETKQVEDSLKELLGGIESGKGNGQLKEVPLRDQFVLAEYLKTHNKIRNIANWAGRFKAIAKTKQKSISNDSISRSGVTIGNDIDRILPSEMVYMANPVSKNDFLRRFAENSTLQYATKGKQSLGKGSIILCLDQSGSMDHLDEQSKGFTLALMSIAKRQKRDFALVTFSDKSQVKQYPKGKITTDEMVKLCQFFLGGGTKFVQPLKDSLDLIKGSRFSNADIVFVTDGNDSLTPDFIKNFNKEKEKLGFSVLSLLIGKQTSSNTVKQFSDEIYCARDFQDGSAHDVFKI